jgi:type II secretory pathway pseudopilin PulG
VGHDGLLRKLVTQTDQPAPGPMSKLLSGAGDPPDLMVAVVVDPLRPLIEQMLPAVPVPPPFESVKKMPGLLSSIEAKADLTGEMGFSLALQARDEASADQVEQIIDQMLALGQQMIQAQIAQQAASDDPIEQAMAQYMTRINKRMMDAVRPVRDGNRFKLAASGEGQMQVAVIGILVALLLPAVNSVRQAARRNQSQSNIRMIGLGLHSYNAQHERLPANIVDENGKPLLSWRVRLLPYLDESDLYDQFKLDEPWDSEHNRQLIPLMPVVFRNPSSTVADPGKTTYLGVAGEGAVFGSKKGLRFAEVRDGTSNTVAMVEANDDRAVVWTAPEDWQFDPDNPLAGLGEARGGIFLALMLDGSTHVISEDVDLAVFKALVTYAGGEVVGDF